MAPRFCISNMMFTCLAIDSKDLFSPLYREKILKIALPQKSRSATVMEGTQQEKAEQLLEILHEKALIQ